MEQAVLSSDSNVIDAAHVAHPDPRRRKQAPPDPSFDAGAGNGASSSIGKFADAERDLIAQALANNGGNVSKAVEHSGITRDRLRYRIENYALDRPE